MILLGPLAASVMGYPCLGHAATSAAAPPLEDPRAEEPLSLELPKPVLEAALEEVLEERGRLRRFQIGTSKFSDGRVVLDELRLLPSHVAGTARFELHASLDFARRQLGVKWRGLKSHKKWFDKGRKDVARVRLTGEIRIDHRHSSVLVASKLRVKLISRLTPARGWTFRFDLDDRRVALPKEGLTGILVDGLRIERSTAEAIHLIGAPRQRLKDAGQVLSNGTSHSSPALHRATTRRP